MKAELPSDLPFTKETPYQSLMGKLGFDVFAKLCEVLEIAVLDFHSRHKNFEDFLPYRNFILKEIFFLLPPWKIPFL